MTDSYWSTESDPYLYSGSTVLRNLPDIRSAVALDAFERRATMLRLDEAVAAVSDGPLNLALWQTIHRVLFQDVYEWAGEIRTVVMAKGNTIFARPEHIQAEGERLFAALRREDLPSLREDQHAARLAYYFGELNVLHPFREGNGRTQKLLFDEIARRTGYAIEWEKMNADTLLKSLIAACHTQDYAALDKLFRAALVRINK